MWFRKLIDIVSIRFVKYKADWYGREFIQVDKYFPSTKKCFPCGAVNYGLTLKDRIWECPSCKSILDRDLNSGNCLNEEGIKFSKCYRGAHGIVSLWRWCKTYHGKPMPPLSLKQEPNLQGLGILSL